MGEEAMTPNPTPAVEALLPCPFCGDPDIVLDTAGEACRYECNQCGAITDSWIKGPGAKEAAAKLWNRRALLRQPEAAPDGWVMAPREPDRAMRMAGYREGIDGFVSGDEAASIFKSMLAAAPQQKDAPDGCLRLCQKLNELMGACEEGNELRSADLRNNILRVFYPEEMGPPPKPTPPTGEAIAHTADDLWLAIRFHTVNMDDDDLAEEIEFACVRAYKSLTKKYPDGWDNVTPPTRPAQPTPAPTGDEDPVACPGPFVWIYDKAMAEGGPVKAREMYQRLASIKHHRGGCACVWNCDEDEIVRPCMAHEEWANTRPNASAEPRGLPDPMPEELFDSYSVLNELTVYEQRRTSAENVTDVLNAAVRLIRRRLDAITHAGEGMKG